MHSNWLNAGLLLLVAGMGQQELRPASAANDPPRVAVGFVVDDSAAPDFRQAAVARALHAALEPVAVEEFRSQFGFFDWSPAGGEAAAQPPDAVLSIVLAGRRRGGWQIFLECKASAGGEEWQIGGGPALRAQVYGPTEMFLGAEVQALAQRTKHKCITKIRDLVRLNRDVWQRDLVEKVSLANEVLVPDPPLPEKLVLPIRAERLNAQPSWTIVVEFERMNQRAIKGRVALQPWIAVFSPGHPLAGLLSCRVRHFQHLADPEVDADGWHPRIPEALKKADKSSLRIYLAPQDESPPSGPLRHI